MSTVLDSTTRVANQVILDRELKTVAECNRQLAASLGGHPQTYKWLLCSELKFYEPAGMEERFMAFDDSDPSRGFHIMVQTYRVYTMADKLGRNPWALGLYTYPEMSLAQHQVQFGTEVPYGPEYRHIGCSNLALGDTPDMPLTIRMIGQIIAQKEISGADIKVLDKAEEREKKQDAVRKQRAKMSDVLTPFGNKPGVLQDVSFPRGILPGTSGVFE